MTHTPGPWRADLEAGAIVLNGSAIYTVRDICSDDRGFNPADVQLMATAPALLERLKAMVGGAECECDKSDYQHPLCDICWSRRVIAQAEGRE
jgi:hypothetical protein